MSDQSVTNPGFLRQHEGILRTTWGGCFPGQRAVFRGKDLHAEFDMLKNPGTTSWMDVFVYGIIGRRLAPNQLRVLEGLWACSSYPDSRLWNNRIACLAGSVRSPGGMGLAGAFASSDTQIMGRQVDQAAADFLWRALKAKKAHEKVRRAELAAQGKSADDIAAILAGELDAVLERFIMAERNRLKGGVACDWQGEVFGFGAETSKIIKGYGRPVATNQEDERLPVTRNLLAREGIAEGEHFQLMLAIEPVLAKIARRPMPITYAAIIVAVTLDMGFEPDQCYLFDVLVFWAGFTPCYLDGKERAEGASFVLSCERLKYAADGAAPRQWADRFTR